MKVLLKSIVQTGLPFKYNLEGSQAKNYNK